MEHHEAFFDTVIQNKSQISEIYFSWGDMPNGRSALSALENTTPFEFQQRQQENLTGLSRENIAFNLLFNGNCYGKDSQSRVFFQKAGDLIDYIKRQFGLSSVTTASPLIARFVKENFPGIDVRASVNMEIGSIEGISYVADVFDSFYVKRELNRNLPALLQLRKWCDENGKQMYLLANSGCLNHCSAHIFHDNLVAHEAEIATMDNGYQFKGVCWDFLSHPGNRKKWLSRTNFIRPEDLWLYEALTPAVKLATRVNSSPVRVLNAYLSRRYGGSIMELLEPNHSGVFYPDYTDNAKFPEDFAQQVLHCDKQCQSCDYCEKVMASATVTLPL